MPHNLQHARTRVPVLPPVYGYRRVQGVGATGTQIAGSVTNTAASIAGSNATSIAAAVGVAVPVVGIVIAGVALAVSVWLNRMGPKQKRWTTQIADEATAQLQEVQAAYAAEPYNPANQAAALAATDSLLEAIADGCGQTQMGAPGRRCVAERLVRDGNAPWCPTGTGCDYYTVYRDPIAFDPRAAAWVETRHSVDFLSAANGAGAVGASWMPLAFIGVAFALLVGVGD